MIVAPGLHAFPSRHTWIVAPLPHAIVLAGANPFPHRMSTTI
jgi:hypothetical protein